MDNDQLKMTFFVNGLTVGLMEKVSLKMEGGVIEVNFGGVTSKKKITLEGKASQALRDRIKSTSVPLHSSDVPVEDFDGVTFDVSLENRNGKMHFRWVNKAAGMESLQALIAAVMELNAPGEKNGSGER